MRNALAKAAFPKGALSSVGRASRLHREGQRFEPVSAHHILIVIYNLSKIGLKATSFIVKQAFGRHANRMRGSFVTLSVGFVVFGAFAMPDAAFAREVDQAETSTCVDPKHRHILVRPLTESLPIRRSEKQRVRRVLM